MNNETEYGGYWWLPNEKDELIFGKLKVSQSDRIELELFGIFGDPLEQDRNISFPLILGISNATKPGMKPEITLYNCTLIKSKTNHPGVHSSLFIVEYALIGFHFNMIEEIRFKRLSVRYAYLDEWVNQSGLNLKNKDTDKLTIEYERPNPITMEVNNWEIMIEFRGPSWSFDRLKQAKITQDVRVRFTPEKDMSLDEYFKRIRDLQNILSLAIATPTYPLELQGVTETNKTNSKGKERHFPVSIFYQVPFLPTELEVVRRQDMLFTLSDIRDQFETYVANWMGKVDILKSVHDLYFSTLYNPYMYLESEFLNLTQAIESYHRRIHGGKYQTNEKYRSGLYKQFVEAIPSDLDRSFKDSLKNGTLYYANEYSLRKRLQELIGKFSQDLELNFVTPSKRRNQFISKVNDTRNYLTHFDPDLEENAAHNQELFDLTQKLRVLLIIGLLEQLGFDFNTIKELLAKNRKYKQFFHPK